MKDRTRVALAVIAGYYLGRRHKLGLAMALAAAGLASGMTRGEGGGGLLQLGSKLLGESPELQQLTGRLRGELVEVGKAAAVAATSRQIDSLSSRLHDRAESLRQPGGGRGADEQAGAEEQTGDGEGERTAGGAGRSRGAEETTDRGAGGRAGPEADEEDQYDEDEYDYVEEPYDEEEQEPPEEEPTPPPRRQRPVRPVSRTRR
ncbi:hypothetical protein [Nonomuraea sp. NPDC003754]